MPPRLRKLALTAHVAFSVGWLGAVAAFLLLAVVGLTSAEEETVRAMYLAMDLVGWRVIVPLCFAALLTGVVQALATPWGLFRHYWILLKLTATVLLTILLMLHIQPTGRLAALAAAGTVFAPALHALQLQLAVDAAGALLGLIAVLALAVYKPQGLTPYGARKLDAAALAGRAPLWVKIFVIGAVLSVIAVRTLSGVHHGRGSHAALSIEVVAENDLGSRARYEARMPGRAIPACTGQFEARSRGMVARFASR